MCLKRVLVAYTFCSVICFGQVAYTYDAGGHLTRAASATGGSIVYAYDAAGNLVGRTVQLGPASIITSVATADGGSFIAQNTFVTITGNNLVPANTPREGVIWSNAPSFNSGQMPTQLGNVGVTVNGKLAYVYFYCSVATSTVCTSDQINILTPLEDTTGIVPVVVTNGNTSSGPYMAEIHPVAPAFLRFGASSYVAATHVDNSLVGPVTLYSGYSTPARPGETIVIY